MNKKPTNTKKKKSIKTKAQKAIVTQNNRFIYAKYNMNANELKFFMWIVAQLNSQKDSLFQICEIPLSEVMQVWQRNDKEADYSYIRDLCNSMLKKTYFEDFRLLDEKTMKEVRVFKGYTLFKSMEYMEGQGFISYQLNDSLMQYLLDQKRDFTQIKFDDIQQMKSAYSIRIYNMLMCEIKQNRQTLKINLSVLQNILEVPKSLLVWQDFKRKVLEQAQKDINAKSNLILFDIKTYKTSRKITDLEFVFDYKNNDKRIKRDNEKYESLIKRLQEIIHKQYMGKSIKTIDGILNIIDTQHMQEERKFYILCENTQGKTFRLEVKNFKDIKQLEKAKDKAEELFYLDKEKMQILHEAKSLFKSFEPKYYTIENCPAFVNNKEWEKEHPQEAQKARIELELSMKENK